MHEENNWGQMTEANVVDETIEKGAREEMVKAIKAVKPGKIAGPSEKCQEMTSASRQVGIKVMAKIHQPLFNGKEV